VDALSRKHFSLAGELIGCVAALGLLFIGAWVLGDVTSSNIAEEYGLSARRNLVDKLQRAPFAYFVGKTGAELYNRLGTDVASLILTVYTAATQTLTAVLSLVFVAITMVAVNWKLALISLALVPIWLFVSARHRVHFKDAENILLSHYDSLSLNSTELLSFYGILRALAFSGRGRDADRLIATCEALLQSGLRIKALFRAQFAILSTGLTVTNVATLVVSLYLYMRGSISAGVLVAFIGFRTTIQYYVTTLANTGAQLMVAEAVMERAREITALTPGYQGSATFDLGPLTAKDLHYTYGDESREVLSGVSLHVNVGEKVGLVGPSGSGKSTLALLLQGLYKPSKGLVAIGGVDVRDAAEEQLSAFFSFSHANEKLLSGTVRDNMIYANPSVSEADIWEAAEVAAIDDLLKALPDGLDADVGVGRSQFSNGEVQRLCLMRSLVKHSSFLVLDEPTTALDAEVESRILEKLRERLHSIVLITHRLPAVLSMDRVLVMETGRIVEEGPPFQLLRRRSRFYAMLSAQIGRSLVDALLERFEAA
jgi:ATP-binding cassette subfamily B protein